MGSLIAKFCNTEADNANSDTNSLFSFDGYTDAISISSLFSANHIRGTYNI